jgi:hypothetical protein
LLDVPNLVQEQCGIRHRIRSKPDITPERDSRDRPHSKAPAADAQRDSITPEARDPKLRKTIEQARGQRQWSAEE